MTAAAISILPIELEYTVEAEEPNLPAIPRKVVKEFSQVISPQELWEIIRATFLIPSSEPVKFRIQCVRKDASISDHMVLSGKILDEAIINYKEDNSTKVIINVQKGSSEWPTFPTPFGNNYGYGDGFPAKTICELKLMKLSSCIRRKDRWYEKMNNPEIIAKWTEEARVERCTTLEISYVLQELQYYASLRDPKSGIEVSDVDWVWHSDTLIEDSLKNDLKRGVTKLENIPFEDRDWHPGSNDQVWDLVHPSLYPLVYGQTRKVKPGIAVIPSLKFCGSGDPYELSQPELEANQADPNSSTKFSWLPAEFMVHEDGHVSIDSYINNLHPVHNKGLYGTLAKIFERFVPLFERVLTDQLHQRPNKVEVADYGNWYGDAEFPDDDDDASDYDERYEQWENSREIILPEPPATFEPPPPPENPLKLAGSQLQVIVKLANIVLTPQNPSYAGGVWHVEGMKNEDIVASGIYYYDVENISESELGFRRDIREPDYQQYDARGVYAVYGLENESALNQVLGSVETKENRCLAFPNAYQHRVHPFKLTDPTRPGHRKILVFFLVNPGKRIVSTLNVPPQQLDWYLEQVNKIPLLSTGLPSEMLDYLFEYLDWPMRLEKAKVLRQELMDERKYFISSNTESVFERSFSLCEH